MLRQDPIYCHAKCLAATIQLSQHTNDASILFCLQANWKHANEKGFCCPGLCVDGMNASNVVRAGCVCVLSAKKWDLAWNMQVRSEHFCNTCHNCSVAARSQNNLYAKLPWARGLQMFLSKEDWVWWNQRCLTLTMDRRYGSMLISMLWLYLSVRGYRCLFITSVITIQHWAYRIPYDSKEC